MADDPKPDERVFLDHIERGPFQSGMDHGRWRLISINWPKAVIAVTAAPRTNGPNEYALRFDLTNYPQWPPTAQPWDADRQAPLEHGKWPDGKSRIPPAFNPGWKGGQCLYLPCDRESISHHPQDWQVRYPWMIWSPNGDITHYLRIVHDLLTSNDYTGARCP